MMCQLVTEMSFPLLAVYEQAMAEITVTSVNVPDMNNVLIQGLS